MFLDYIRPPCHGEGSVGEFPSQRSGMSASLKVARGRCLGLPAPIRDHFFFA